MQKVVLGKSNLEVSKLCFGTLPMGYLQADMSVKEGSKLIKAAIDLGINFFDTAEMYGTYPHLREGIKNKKIILATKSTAKEYKEMEKSVKKALKELNLDKISLFHLHSARDGIEVFDEKEGAIRCLLDYQKKGKIHSIGISTHNVKVVKLAARKDYIDVVYPLINKKGFGILEGKPKDMLSAMKFAHSKGKGIYAMKVFAGGNLLNKYNDSLNYVLKKNFVHSISVGMVDEKELDINFKIFSGEKVYQKTLSKIRKQKKMVILKFCKGCGKCIETCPNNAISLVDNKARIDYSICVICGYCASACPGFFIRMV